MLCVRTHAGCSVLGLEVDCGGAGQPHKMLSRTAHPCNDPIHPAEPTPALPVSLPHCRRGSLICLPIWSYLHCSPPRAHPVVLLWVTRAADLWCGRWVLVTWVFSPVPRGEWGCTVVGELGSQHTSVLSLPLAWAEWLLVPQFPCLYNGFHMYLPRGRRWCCF